MNNFKKDLACNITLISVLAFTAIHILILTLNLFGVTKFEFYEGFNYLIAYILVVVCLALYVFGFFLSNFKRLTIPKWFRIMFYIAFYLFTNAYYTAGLYQNIYTVIVFMAYISLLVNIASLSVFYNTQKDEKNRLKSTNKYLLTSVFFYSVATNAIIQFLINAFKAIVVPNYVFSTLMVFVIEMSTMLLVTIIMTVIYHASLNKTKSFVNGCLIKVDGASPVKTRS